MQNPYSPLKKIYNSESGVVLVTVVILLALLLIMVVAFLGIATSERKATKALSDESEAFTLSDSAISLVTSQLRAATSGLGTTETWASQPGMIRRYNNQGQLTKVFRLYSSSELTSDVTGPFDLAAELPPADWASQPAIWTNLNQPGKVASDDTDTASTRLIYPILDPSATTDVEGLSIENAPGGTGDIQAPMPVKWLYVLEDGSIVPIVGGSGKTAKVGGSPTASNPIVGRIAFWADDETCKVNVNTASEGVYWSTPRTNAASDELLADRQPVKNEFQRYPGHPATTSLSPILGKWLGTNPQTYYDLTPRIVRGGSDGGSRKVDPSTPNIVLDKDRLYATVDEYIFKALGATGQRQPNNTALTQDVIEKNRFLLTTVSAAPEVNLFNQPRISLWPLQVDPARRSPVDKLIAFCASTGDRTAQKPFYLQRETIYKGMTDSSSQRPTRDYENVARNKEMYSYLQKLTSENVPGFGGRFSSKLGADRDQVLTEMFDFTRSGVNSLSKGNSTGNFDYAPTRPPEGGQEGEGQIIPLQIAANNTMGFGRFVTITEAAIIIYPSQIALPTDLPPGQSPIVDVPMPQNDKDAGATRKVLRAKSVRAFVMVEYFCATPGFPAWSPSFNINLAVTGFTLNGRPLLQGGSLSPYALIGGGNAPGDGGGRWLAGYGHTTSMFGLFQPFQKKVDQKRDFNASGQSDGYAWRSAAPVELTLADPSTNPGEASSGLDFSGGTLTFTIRNKRLESVQTVTMEFPSTRIPVPYIWPKSKAVMDAAVTQIANGQQPNWTSLYRPLEVDLDNRMRLFQGSEQNSLVSQFLDIPAMQTLINTTKIDAASLLIMRPGDVVRSMEADANAAPKGDLRFYAATKTVPKEWFGKGGFPGQYDSTDRVRGRFAQGLRQNNNWQFLGQFATFPDNIDGGDRFTPSEVQYGADVHPYHRTPTILTSGSLVKGFRPSGTYSGVNWFQGNTSLGNQQKVLSDGAFTTARGVSAALRSDGRPGDFDTGYGMTEDGPYINKPDESNSFFEPGDGFANEKHLGSYYSRGLYIMDRTSLNNVPNRQIASAVAFGSLPSGIKRNQPWQTLLFSPNPAGRTTPSTSAPTAADHPGFANPPDHTLLDLFWMPVAQPYAISQPLSTSGKININYQIMPFSYIKRRTPMYSLMKNVHVEALSPIVAAPSGGGGSYHQSPDDSMPWETRYNINMDETTGTLRGFEQRFDQGDIFRSASEICDIFLVPKRRVAQTGTGDPIGRAYPGSDPTYDTMTAWWNRHELTGDNMREAPYNHIYPRITTKSNTYQVHMRVQKIQKNVKSPPDEFQTDVDQVTAEYRGSAIIERYVDPNDPELPDFAQASDLSLDEFYNFRVSQRQKFRP